MYRNQPHLSQTSTRIRHHADSFWSIQKPPVRCGSGTADSIVLRPSASHTGVSAPLAALRGPLKEDMVVAHQPGQQAWEEENKQQQQQQQQERML